MAFFLLLTWCKGQECGCSEGVAVQGAHQRHKQGSSPRRVTDDAGGSGRFFLGRWECTERRKFLEDWERWRTRTEILLLGLLAWCSGSQATQIAWFPSNERHQGCSWVFQMGLFCLSERCVCWSQLRPLILLALPFHLTTGSSILLFPCCWVTLGGRLCVPKHGM